MSKLNRLEKLYHGNKNICCKCGCTLETMNDIPLGEVFVMDKEGKFYCMGCDEIFEDGDERIYEPEFDISEMNIYEVMDSLSGLLDGLVEYMGPECDENELNRIAEIESRIYEFIYKYAPKEE